MFTDLTKICNIQKLTSLRRQGASMVKKKFILRMQLFEFFWNQNGQNVNDNNDWNITKKDDHSEMGMIKNLLIFFILPPGAE